MRMKLSWLAAFDGSEDLQLNTRIRYQNHIPWSNLNEPDTIHVVMQTPTMEAVQKHMENDAELISEAGDDSDHIVFSMFHGIRLGI